MKYADSWYYSYALSPTNKTTFVTDWMDVGFANELISDLKTVMAGDVDETLDVTLERFADPVTAVTVLTHTQVTADGTVEDEVDGSSIGAGTAIIGARVRYRFTIAGTWTATTIAVTLNLIAKRN